MSEYLVYNGAFHKNDTPLIGADNRGLRYGDGLFETIKYSKGKLQLANWHFERLFSGLQLLEFILPPRFTAAHLAEQVEALCKKNKQVNARIRINVFRGNGGLYDVENHTPNCIIQSWPLEDADFHLNENGLETGIYQSARKTMDGFANCKSNNYLPYTMAALHVKKQRWNDAFLLNTAGRICDATIANVFMIKNKIIYTAPLLEGCIAGVMRRFLLENLPERGFAVEEQIITETDLLGADEVFLTNAIKGIRWVSHCHDANYTNHLTTSIFDKLLKK
ncbi:MAG: aminotransferase class IV [Chitinophagaceae bacterium]